HTITPIAEPVSIDEVFLDISGCLPLFKSKKEIAQTLQRRVWEKQHLTASIGIAPNKLLAKIASDFKKPSGITIIHRDDVKKFLQKLLVHEVPGIGKKTNKILNNLGIKFVDDINKFTESILVQKFGKYGRHLFQIGKGIDDSSVIPVSRKPKPKSIGNEITLSESTRDKEKLRKVLLQLTHETAYRLRKKNAVAHTITLKVKYDDFSVNTFNHTIEQAVNYDSEIYKIVIGLFDKINLGFRKIRLLGIRLSNLEFAEDPVQLTIFSLYKKKFASISQAVDKLKQKYGEKIINIGQ
ncbi:MAG: DNA polymerase IV, partial [Candidatus Cloacimonetes bacterium]|nr:DNA polymerase IV [Candidatus Cloacimonadota bacterium]